MKSSHENRTFGLSSLAVAVALAISLYGCGGGSTASVENQLQGYPIASDVSTTLQRTVVADPVPAGAPVLRVFETAKFKTNGYGIWHYGPGVNSVKRLDIMPASYSGPSATNAARLLNFFAVTDVHIADKETPTSAVFFGWAGRVLGGYSPTTLYSTQVLDATVQTINAIHKQTPLDFGISLGDSLNNNQYNEARWYIDVLDGKNINPDSGAKDDPVAGPYNDYQDEYKAAGLDKSIKWYQALGNHDQFWMGSGATNDYIRQNRLGTDILNLGNPFTDPLGTDSRGYYMGSIDGRSVWGDVIGVGPIASFAVAPKVLAADPNRRSLSRKELMGEFLNTTSLPVGHGFTQANIDKNFACYSFEPRSDVPIKMIVLDDTQRQDDPNVGGYAHASLDNERYDWLVSELEKGQTEGKLMIIAAHMPIGVELPGSYTGWSVNSSVTEEKLIAKLHTYSNLILWIAGHRHLNAVTALKSPDASRPELGFWQIETSSLKDLPQQFRTLEIVRNSDDTISIFATNVDPAVKPGSLAEISRSYSVAAQQVFKHEIGSYNAEVVKQLSPQMQAKIRNLGTPIVK